MFKTILKIAVLSATAITLLSACGAATRALNSAADDALNAALAKAEKRYEKRYTEYISNLKDENGNPIKVYIDENGNPFHGNSIKVNIDDKIEVNKDDNGNPIQVTIDDKGNPTPVTIDDKSNPIPVTIDDKSDPILAVATAPTTAEICSYRYVGSLRQSPCDKHEASIQRLHEYCLNNPFNSGCKDDDSYDDARHGYCLNDPFDSHRGCLSDDRYKNARFEKCKVDFRYECTHGGLEFYPLRIQFCNNPMNARYNSYKLCEVSYKPWVSHDGDTQSEFLQRGTKDGLNTGSLRASLSDATAPVVHTLKLSDSDDGVAFFSGIAPDRGQDRYYRTYYAGILPKNNLGAPITQTRGTATWQGTFSTINSATQTSDSFRTDKDFNLEIDFTKKQLSASISGIENKDKNNHLDADTRWTHTDYRLSGVFAEGKIEGYLHITTFLEGRDDSKSWTTPARVSGLIGQDGAVAAFVDGLGFHSSGGFVARPPSK